MSKSATRYALVDVLPIAHAALEAVRPYAEPAAIAGSIRRGRGDVGDIDLVVVLDQENPWARNEPIRVLCELGYSVLREGEQIVSFNRADGGIGLDLYIATPASFGMVLLIRTGSAAHNIKLASHAQKKCLPARKFTHRGIEDTAGRVVAGETEREVFAALGLPYLEPRDREAPEWESYVRPDGA